MSTLKQRFAALAKLHPGITQADLARATGAKPPSVSAWFSGKTTSMKAATAAKAAEVYGCNPHWLATGEGEMVYVKNISTNKENNENQLSFHLSNVEGAPTLVQSRKVPVIGEVKGGLDGFLEELMYPVGHGEGYVEYWCKDEHAYALRVRGDSMHPRYRAGEFVVVTPSIEAQPGSDVVVQLADGRKLLKQLNWVRSDEIQLLSINNGYDPLTVSTSEVISVQLVAGGVGRHAFVSH